MNLQPPLRERSAGERGPTLLHPLTLRSRTLRNRIVISPMSQFSASGMDGFTTAGTLCT